MGGMHQAPARIDIDVLVKPLQRPLTTPRKAVGHLFLLLGNMDVHRTLFIAARQHLSDLLWSNSSQRVKTQAQVLRGLLREHRCQALLQRQILLGAVDESTLALVGLLAAKTGVAVQHRQQGQADACCTGCLADTPGQLGGVGIGLPGRVMVYIVEFGNAGITGLEHFDVKLAGDDLELLGADLANQPVHQLAPGPEAIVGVARHFCQAGHGALERMGMQIRHARQHRTAQALGALGTGIDLDCAKPAICVHLQAHIVGPTVSQ